MASFRSRFPRLRVLWLLLLSLALAGGLTVPAGAQGVLDLRDQPAAAAGHMAMLLDPDGRLGIADVSAGPLREAFVPVPGAIRAGYTAATVWVRFRVRRAGGGVWWMAVEPAFLDSVTLFVPDGQGGWTSQQGGDGGPVSAMPVPYRLPVFPLTLPAGQEVEVYLRLRSASVISAEPVLYPPELLTHDAARQALLVGGLLALYLAITLAIVWYTRLQNALYQSYCAWMVANGLAFFCIYGYAHEFLLTGGTGASSRLHEIAAVAALPIGTFFVSRLLFLDRNRPRFARLYAAGGWAGTACLAATLAGYYEQVMVAVSALGALFGLLAVGLSVDLAWRGFKPARLYALAFAAHPFGLLLGLLGNVGLVTPNALVNNAYAIASLLNAVALAVGLLDRLNMEERARVEAQQAALRRTEQALHQTEALFETLAAAAPVPLLVASPARHAILFANDSAARLLAMPVTEILAGAALDRLLPPGDLVRLTAALQAQDVVTDLETAVIARDGNRPWTVLSAARVHFKGEPALLIGLNDITARRRLEGELVEARNEAEAALALKQIRMREQRQLISTAAHEFKTPLAVIDRAAQMLQFDLQSEAADPERAGGRAADRLHMVRDSVRRLRGTVDSFLADAALEAGRLPVSLEPTDLAPLVERALAILDARQPPRTAHCSLPPGGTLICQADGRLLSIVLDNILDNACKYSPPDTVIDVVGEADGDSLLLTVADRGIGIPPEELDMVGSRFFRASNAAGTAGTGLGLATARHLMVLQNGSITLDRRQDGGTAVSISLARWSA